MCFNTKNVLAVAHVNGTIQLWDPDTGEKSGSFIVDKEGIGGIAFSPDGSFMAVGHQDGSVSFRDSSGEELGEIPAQFPSMTADAIALSPDGKFLATGGMPKNQGPSLIYLSDLGEMPRENEVTGRLKAKLHGHQDYTYSLVFSPDSKLLASASQDETVGIWDVQTTKHLKRITQHTDFVYDVAFSPDGKLLATLGRDSLKLWTVKELRNEK